jgi:hypothetical protein
MKLVFYPTMIALLGLSLTAKDKPADVLKAAQQETRFAKLEVQLLREAMVKEQLKPIQDEEKSLYGELCQAEGLDPDPKVCAVDLERKTVTKREAPAAPVQAAPAAPANPTAPKR